MRALKLMRTPDVMCRRDALLIVPIVARHGACIEKRTRRAGLRR